MKKKKHRVFFIRMIFIFSRRIYLATSYCLNGRIMIKVPVNYTMRHIFYFKEVRLLSMYGN
ncbi:MAG: hypothetical protein AMS23_06930 [Bacteroides sp. SM1_62]|nr:MAG: hypothetical protein AMS23_06930 [Bacteroides sp. SM1_62]